MTRVCPQCARGLPDAVKACAWCEVTAGIPSSVLQHRAASALLRGRVRVREMGADAAKRAFLASLKPWSGTLAFIEWRTKQHSRAGTEANPNTLGVVQSLTLPALRDHFASYAQRVVAKGTGKCVAYSRTRYGGSSDTETHARTALFMDCDGRGDGAPLLRLLQECGVAHLISRRKANHHLVLPLAESVPVTADGKLAHMDAWGFLLGVFSELACFKIDGGTAEKPSPTTLGYDVSSAMRFAQLEYLYTRREQSDAVPSVQAQEGVAVDYAKLLDAFGYLAPPAPPRKVRPRKAVHRDWNANTEAPPPDAPAWIRALFDAGMLGERVGEKGFVCTCPLAHEHTEHEHSPTSTIVLNDGALVCLRGGNHLHGRLDVAREAMPEHVLHYFDTAGQARLREMLAVEQPQQLSRDEASVLLEETVRAGGGEEVLVVQAPTGVGKSHAARAVAATSIESCLLTGPSHRLLEQNRDAFEAHHNQPASLRRGVLRVLNADGTPACKLYDVAVRVQEVGASVPEVLCKGCKHASDCIALQTEVPARVEFLPHAMMLQRMRKKEGIARIIADETPSLLTPHHLGIADIKRLYRAATSKNAAEKAPFVGGWTAVVRPWLAIVREVMNHGGLAEATSAALDNAEGDEWIAAAVHRATTTRGEKKRVHDPEREKRYLQFRDEVPPELGETFARACAAMRVCGRPRLREDVRLEELEESERTRILALIASANALYAMAESWRSIRGDAHGVRCHALTVEARTLREHGGVILDATPTMPLLEAVFPNLRVVRIGARDGVPGVREVHYREGATRSRWCPGGKVQWERVLPVLQQALERVRKAGATRVLLVAYSHVEAGLRDKAPAKVRAVLDAFAAEGGVIEFAHYGPGVRGLDQWATFDAFVTLGDPWADVEAVHELSAAAGADAERVALAMVRADLAQAHGRARDPQRSKAALHLHYGAVAPEGWSTADTTIVCAARGRKAVRAMQANEFAEAVTRRWGGVRAAAVALGVSPSSVSRWVDGSRGVPDAIASRVREVVLPEFPVESSSLVGHSGNTPPQPPERAHAPPQTPPRRVSEPATIAQYTYRYTPSGQWQARAISAPSPPWEANASSSEPWFPVPPEHVPPDVRQQLGAA